MKKIILSIITLTFFEPLSASAVENFTFDCNHLPRLERTAYGGSTPLFICEESQFPSRYQVTGRHLGNTAILTAREICDNRFEVSRARVTCDKYQAPPPPDDEDDDWVDPCTLNPRCF